MKFSFDWPIAFREERGYLKIMVIYTQGVNKVRRHYSITYNFRIIMSIQS